MEWILFVALSVSSVEYKSYSVSVVPGFATYAECQDAGYQLVRIMARSNGDKPLNYVCVERKKIEVRNDNTICRDTGKR